MSNRVRGKLAFDTARQSERARRDFRLKCDAIHINFKIAGGLWRASHVRCYVEAASDTIEQLADVAAGRGITLPDIQNLTLTLFDEFVADVRYILQGKRTDNLLLDTLARFAEAERAEVVKLVKGSHRALPPEYVREWIKKFEGRNGTLAWKTFKSVPDHNGVTKTEFERDWREVRPAARGRPKGSL